MILIGLTGGIGSGKSEVARLLTNRGAVLIDADQIVRELQRPGAEVYLKMVELFGPDVVASDKSLDRAAIATRVFSDSNLLKTLNELIHPIVRRVMNERIESFRETDKVVVLDIPLLVENPREGLDGVLVVDLDVDLALGRLVEQRNMSVEDANARIAKQATREQRLAIADHVIDNSGDRTQLEEKVETAWSWIQSLK
ncbi:MAG: dephospho-CoA kinase [Actinobacteria bacterium]|nr:dephospho-CoA kinase [Actinomycetota bacterium]NCU80644.1 dephospho-CoA kinase [Acidimicrobiia bacterium]NDC99423.1 dephospho-CoA kinase [bacterium]NBQ44787.1 dephospho-CoA kinase [Actinomycetota bacterium]NCU86284.1 dephospho-CoA kinase [Actinomycetota bacterium]